MTGNCKQTTNELVTEYDSARLRQSRALTPSLCSARANQASLALIHTAALLDCWSARIMSI